MIKARVFTISDYREEELWLRRQHQEGLRFVRVALPCFYIFEPCEPEDVVYRLDYRNGETGEDYFRMAEDFGWEYVASCVGWLYFRKPAAELEAEGGEDFFTDDAGKAEMVARIVKTRMLPLLVVFFVCLLPNWLRSLDGRYGLLENILCGVFTGLLCLYLYIFLHCGVKLWRLRKEFEGR